MAGTWHLLLTVSLSFIECKVGGPFESDLGVPWQGCFQSWMCAEGKLVVITEQMPLMRSLLDFQLASRALHWDRNTEVTGWFCDVTSSPVVIAAIIILLKESLRVLASHISFSTYGNHGASLHSEERASIPELFKRKQSLFSLHHYNHCYCFNKDYAAALDCRKKIIKTGREDPRSYPQHVGICDHFLKHLPEQKCFFNEHLHYYFFKCAIITMLLFTFVSTNNLYVSVLRVGKVWWFL